MPASPPVARVPVGPTPGVDRFVDHPGGAQVGSGEGRGEVIDDPGQPGPLQAGPTTTPPEATTPPTPPTPPTETTTPAPTPDTPGGVEPQPGPTPERANPELGNVRIDPQTGVVTEDGEVMGRVDVTGGPITLTDGTVTEIVYSPQNGGTVQVGNGPATPLHDGTFGLLPGNVLVEVGPRSERTLRPRATPFRPVSRPCPSGPIDGRPDPGGDPAPPPPMGEGDGELGAGACASDGRRAMAGSVRPPVPPMGEGDGGLGQAPVPPMGEGVEVVSRRAPLPAATTRPASDGRRATAKASRPCPQDFPAMRPRFRPPAPSSPS